MAIKGIVCIGANGVMGKDGKMPWGDIPLDGRHFQNLTTGHVVLMGRKTFESMRGEPLPKREHIVLSNQFGVLGGVYGTDSWWDALAYYFEHHKDKDLWVIGGSRVFETFLPFIEEFYVTTVGDEFEGDTFLPNIHERYNWESHLLGQEDIAVPKIPDMIVFNPSRGIPEPDELIQVDRYHLTYRVFTKPLELSVTEFLKDMYGVDTTREKG